MAYEAGQPKHPGSGRKPGTPNRATREAQELADQLGINPFEVLLRFAAGDTDALGLKPYVDGKGRHRDPAVPLDLRMQAAAAASRFLLPQLKAVEMTGAGGGPIEAFLALGEDGLRQRREELSMALSADV
jgi:hypothetical protein